MDNTMYKLKDGVLVQLTADEIAYIDAMNAESLIKLAIREKQVTVNMTSLRLALIDAELLDTVEFIINSIPDAVKKRKVLTWWEFSPTVQNNHPLVLEIIAAAQFTPEQVDTIFANAEKI